MVQTIQGHSNGTPSSSRDRILPPLTARTFLLCLSKKDGKILWQNEVSKLSFIKEGERFSTLPPSPTASARSFSRHRRPPSTSTWTEETLEGNLQKDHGEWRYQWGGVDLYGASPVLKRASSTAVCIAMSARALAQIRKPGRKK